MMRSDITSLNQGVRNANDAISLIQTADGALGVIDEKLIRMKELAEQASTGTYTSTQRLIIDSEYQAMASEITRIANATDFNGIKLLDGNLSSAQHSGVGQDATGKLKVHFGTGNDSAEDYYYIQIQDVTAKALGVGNSTNYKEMMAGAKQDSLDMLAKNFGSMKTGDATARAAYSRMEKATTDLFADVEKKVDSIFTADGNAAVNFANLFAKVDVGAAMAAAGTMAGGVSAGASNTDVSNAAASAYGAIMADAAKTRIYADKEELDAAAKALYDELAANNVFKGLGASETNTKAGFDGLVVGSVAVAGANGITNAYHQSALTAVATLYDRAIIAAPGADVPAEMTSEDFAKIPDVQKDAMKANVAMAFLNTMTNGSTTSMSIGINESATAGNATSNFGQLNNMNAAGEKTTGTALSSTKLSDAQMTNLLGKFSAGYAQAVGTNTASTVDGTAGWAVGDVTTGNATNREIEDLITDTTAADDQRLSGMTQAAKTVEAGAAGGYKTGNADTTTLTLNGTLTAPNAATGTGFRRAGFAANSLQKAYAEGLAATAQQTASTSSLAGNNIQTQDAAQKSLKALDNAILKKDNVRADLGAMQNRLENTITNLQVQAENLQAAESRISDVDVATEMTNFVKTQILTQTAVSMLAQANTMPQMAQKLIG